MNTAASKSSTNAEQSPPSFAFRLSSPPFHLSSRSSVVVRPSLLFPPPKEAITLLWGEILEMQTASRRLPPLLLIPSHQPRYLFCAFNLQGKARTFEARRDA